MVQDMQQRAGETDSRHCREARAKSEYSHTETQGDDADVLDAVVSEQALEVMLRQREQDAHYSGGETDPAQHPSPPGLRGAQNHHDANNP